MKCGYRGYLSVRSREIYLLRREAFVVLHRLPQHITMVSRKTKKVKKVSKRAKSVKDTADKRNSGEELDETAERDDLSDLDSGASSAGSADELDELDLVLDQLSSDNSSADEDWTPQTTPRKRKRNDSGLFSISPSPARSNRSASPDTVVSGTGSVTPASSFGKSKDNWHSSDDPDTEPRQPVFKPVRTPGPQLVSIASYSPLQCFEMFFSTSVMQKIVANTNAYGAKYKEGRKRKWSDITVKDLKSYLALVIYMGLLKCFTLTDYWKTSNIYRLPYPARIMTSRKFQKISSALHLSDPKVDAKNDMKKGTPKYDRLGRIKPLYQDIRVACKTFFHPFQNISIDERMVASKARNGLKQYMKNKPTKWGYKLFVLADSLSGYTWDFFIYEGKTDSERSKGISYDSVMSLVNEKLLGTGYKLFVDNFYTSPKLFKDLLSKRIWACGTVRANRIGHSKQPAPRGNIRWFRDNKLLFVEWKDKRDVLMCSTIHKAFNGDTVKRKVKGADGVWTIQEFPVPAAVLDYNKHMGGVDLSDALIGYYTVLHKTRKWYRSFFYHFVDIAVVNAFIMHQHLSKVRNQKPLTQKMFRETLVSELAGSLPPAPNMRIPQTPSHAPSAGSHLPKYSSQNSTVGRRKCKLCRLKTPVVCATCEVHLCFVPKRECFTNWHKSGEASSSK